MIGLDCNILVQIAIADHPANVRTLAAVQSETQQGTKLVFPSLVVTEFLHVVTDERRFAPPLTMPEAVDWIDEFLTNPAVSLLEATQASMNQTPRGDARRRELGVPSIASHRLSCDLGKPTRFWRVSNLHPRS